MTFPVQRLAEGQRAAIVAHFLALPVIDRALRFGTPLSPALISAYVIGIDFNRDAVFGVHNDRTALVAVAHVAIEGERAELALSVLPTHRHAGIGSALFRRAVAHARNRGTPALVMYCLAKNRPVMRIAQKFGMDIIASGGHATAHVELQPVAASFGDAANDATEDSFVGSDRLSERR